MSGAVDAAIAELRAALGDRVRTGVPMAPMTTFRIGGPAAIYLEVSTDVDLDVVSSTMRSTGLPVAIVGKGSNLLVDDAGFPGVVLRLGRGYRWIAREGEVLTAGAATPLPALAGEASRHGLAGLAFAVAIPASFGGGVRMNAGAHGGSLGDVVTSARGVDLDSGHHQVWDVADLAFGYRSSGLPRSAVITVATVRLVAGDLVRIRAAMDEARRWRRETQPLAEPNCGSVFTNPPGDHAARLIDEAGLKGLRVGGAHVSTKHANFIVADPGARAADVRRLIDQIREAVRARAGVDLVPEVRLIGASDGG